MPMLRLAILMVPLMALLSSAIGCGDAGGDNAAGGGPVKPDARLFGVWVPATMQSSEAPPVDNPLLGFRFSQTHAEMAAVGRDGFCGRSHYARTADGLLAINAVSDAGADNRAPATKHFVIEFFSDDAARVTMGSLQVFVRRVDPATVPQLPFASEQQQPPPAND